MATAPSLTLQPIQTKAEEQRWLDFPRELYTQDPNWISHLDMEVRNVFSPKKNPFFEHGEAIRFLALRDGRVVGRIAAFINAKKAAKFDVPTGGTGFFEAINDQAVAFALFDAAREWLTERGMEAMDGPINFGENDRFWGLLIDGFSPPGYGMPYNPPYYQAFFEDYGFGLYFSQVSKHLMLDKPDIFPERFLRINQWIKEKGHVTTEPARRKSIKKYAQDFLTIYNDAWQFHENFTPMSEAQVMTMIKQLNQVLIEELAIFSYVDGEPAGFVVALPDLNQIFRPWNGKINLLEGLKFMWRKRNQYAWYRKRGILTRARVVIMGVRPRFQKFGVETAMVVDPVEPVRAMGFKEIELSWVGDFNPKMRAVLDATGAEYAKTHHTYRYYFSEEKREEQRRSSIIPLGQSSKNGQQLQDATAAASPDAIHSPDGLSESKESAS